MKIYLAGRYSRRDEFRGISKVLCAFGHTVTSRWLDENEPLAGTMTQSYGFLENTQWVDLEDIKSAEAMVFYSEDPLIGTPRGGRHVEFGYALALGKPIYVIGVRENVFHFNRNVTHFDSLGEFLAITN